MRSSGIDFLDMFGPRRVLPRPGRGLYPKRRIKQGALDFVNCCQTCEDPRCIDACGDEAITFRADKGEVVIDETRCTGCGRCALACPYDAIVMADKQHEPALRDRSMCRHVSFLIIYRN